MSILRHFGQVQHWAQTHFGEVTPCAGWARPPAATIARLSQGRAYASKAAYSLPGHAQATPDALQAPRRQHVAQHLQAPGTFLPIEDTTELSWPEAAERRPGLGPLGPGKATSQGVLVAA